MLMFSKSVPFYIFNYWGEKAEVRVATEANGFYFPDYVFVQ